MIKTSIFLVVAALAMPGDIRGEESATVAPFGCIEPEIFYDVLNQAGGAGAKAQAKPFATSCRPLARMPYLRVAEEDGLVKIRVFPKPGDWATSTIVYTLDEMLGPEEILDGAAATR